MCFDIWLQSTTKPGSDVWAQDRHAAGGKITFGYQRRIPNFSRSTLELEWLQASSRAGPESYLTANCIFLYSFV
jgi:hypothetical protein